MSNGARLAVTPVPVEARVTVDGLGVILNQAVANFNGNLAWGFFHSAVRDETSGLD